MAMVRGVTMAQLQDIGADVGVGVYSEASDRGIFTNFRLKLIGDKPRQYQRLGAEHWYASGKQRQVNAVCWHGWRDFLTELFARYPDARVDTTLAKYDGLSGFLDNYPRTAHINMGGALLPQGYSTLCTC